MCFIFRSNTLGVSGCVLVMCLRCLWLLHVHIIHYGLNSHIYDACGNNEHQPPNNMYYEIQAWKYNEILEM
jgi:hypothetical protein